MGRAGALGRSRVVKRILELVKVSGGGGHVMLLDCRLLMRRHVARQRDAVPLLEGVERLDRALGDDQVG